MKQNQIRIKSDGTGKGTTITTSEGNQVHDVLALNLMMDRRGTTVDLKMIGGEIDIIAACTNIEDLAKELHEAGRAAVEQGNTVAAEKFGEQTRKFIEWDELTEPAKDGRRIQAKYLLQKYHIREKRHE